MEGRQTEGLGFKTRLYRMNAGRYRKWRTSQNEAVELGKGAQLVSPGGPCSASPLPTLGNF